MKKTLSLLLSLVMLLSIGSALADNGRSSVQARYRASADRLHSSACTRNSQELSSKT